MADDLKIMISEKVLTARSRARLTQEQLSAIIERSVETVSNIERGISLPTVDTIDRIARAVSVPITFFFEGVRYDAEVGPNDRAISELGSIVSKLSTRDAWLLVSLAKIMSNQD